MESRKWWIISISGYGTGAFWGTTQEAEEFRSNKASWEAGIGRKREATVDDREEICQERIVLTWKREREYPLDERELEAINARLP